MARHEVFYTSHAEGWTAELASPGAANVVTVSRSTLTETRASMRAAAASQLGIDPGELLLDELVDVGERRYARVA
jgi:hypothetical protein